MKRVVVIGSGGSGKSTFAKQLSERTGIDVIHLDREYWRPNWEKTPVDEWEAKVAEMTSKDSWIMDGNFGGTRKMRMQACDTVIFLDLPRYVCIYRILKRTVLYYGKTRPDMADGCKERLDLEFFLWVWNYPNRGRRRIISELEGCSEKNVIVLRSRTAASKFLESVNENN